MKLTSRAVFAHHTRHLLCAVLFLTFAPNAARADELFLTFAPNAARADERCQQLEALNHQYAGVALTSAQKQLKRQLVAWYKQNCGSRRAEARS